MKYFKKFVFAIIFALLVSATYGKTTKKEKTPKTTTEKTTSKRAAYKKKLMEEIIVMPTDSVVDSDAAEANQKNTETKPLEETPAKNTESEQAKSDVIPQETTQAEQIAEEKTEPAIVAEAQTEIPEEKSPELPIIPPVIDTTQQVDRYKKVYLSDFMDIPDYALPSETQSSDADFITDLNDVDSFGRTSLMNAVRAGNDWKVRALLGAGADINAKDNDGWTALMYAVRYQSNLPILNILLENNPDIRTLNNYGLSALVLASCYNDNPDIIKKMLSYYSPSEKEVQKAFVLLLSTQSISEYTLIAKMKVFIDLGLPINSYYDGKTPLMYACKFSSSTKAIKLLVDNNATISVRSSDGKTAFEYATENKNLKRDDIYWSLNQR